IGSATHPRPFTRLSPAKSAAAGVVARSAYLRRRRSMNHVMIAATAATPKPIIGPSCQERPADSATLEVRRPLLEERGLSFLVVLRCEARLDHGVHAVEVAAGR